MCRKLWIPIVAVAALAVLAGGGAYVYYFSGLRTAPATLALSSPSATASTTPAGTATASGGTWRVMTGSVAGYRVKEQFVGQSSAHEAGARTSEVTGQVSVAELGGAYRMTSATVTVQLRSLASVD